MKKLFLSLLILPFSSFAQTFAGAGGRVSQNYFCIANALGSSNSITLNLQNIFTILARLYNQYAIWIFLVLLIPFSWVIIKSLIDKALPWEDLNKYAWNFGSLIFIGLLLNIMSGPTASVKSTDRSFYVDIRNPEQKLVKCSSDSKNAIFIGRDYIRRTK